MTGWAIRPTMRRVIAGGLRHPPGPTPIAGRMAGIAARRGGPADYVPRCALHGAQRLMWWESRYLVRIRRRDCNPCALSDLEEGAPSPPPAAPGEPLSR